MPRINSVHSTHTSLCVLTPSNPRRDTLYA
nr:MAG TPA: hypothetical protein [Caudoviricetes sp.]